MKIKLCDIGKHLIDDCSDVIGVDIIQGNIFEQEYQAIITPTNSFCFMDGNFDDKIIRKYGKDVEKFMQDTRDNVYDGEVPVGRAIGYLKYGNPLIIAAPTMRVPMLLNGTVNPYIAMIAAFKMAKRWEMQVVALPGMGTGCGGMKGHIFARQLQAASRDYCKPVIYKNWQEAQAKHFYLAGLTDVHY